MYDLIGISKNDKVKKLKLSDVFEMDKKKSSVNNKKKKTNGKDFKGNKKKKPKSK
jgi:hypothetical protein